MAPLTVDVLGLIGLEFTALAIVATGMLVSLIFSHQLSEWFKSIWERYFP